MKKLLQAGPGLMIGIPTLGRPVPLEWALAFKAMNPPINFNVSFSIVRGKEVADARNLIAQQAVDNDAKYLFFLGDDVEVPAHSLRQLIYRIQNNPKIGVVGGIYCSKCDPPAPLVFRENGRGSYWDWKVGEFFPVTGLGMDCTLIQVDILKEISKPWFKTVDTDGYLDGENKAEQWTEDLYFLNKVKLETDYEIYCDAGVICKHHDVYGGKYYGLPQDCLPMRQMAISSGSKKRLIINADTKREFDGIVDIYFGSEDWHDYRGTPDVLPFDSNYFDEVLDLSATPQMTEEMTRVTKR